MIATTAVAALALLGTAPVLADSARPERDGDLFQGHARAAGLPRIRLHDLRHTAATLLTSRVVPMLTAASLLGHDPMIFAKVYGHDYEEDLRRAADSLSDVFTAGERAGDGETL